jgi:heavy metal sensor kinase
MIRSFRLQITAWYLALFSVLFVAFGFFVYGVVGRAMRNRLDDRLISEANTATGLFEEEMRELSGDTAAAATEAASEMLLKGSSLAILRRNSLVASAGQVAHLDDLSSIPDGHVATAPHYRAAVRRLSDGIVVAAMAPLDAIPTDLALLRRVLLLAVPLALALAGIGGFVLAGRKLAPVGWMAEQARRIGDRNLDARLEIGNAAEELTTLAASFNDLLGRLDQSFESMKRFVADASHELRTPLSVIRGEADVALSHDRSPAEYREALATILDESRRLSRLVDDLLNLARADAGHVQLQVQEFYFNDLLAECCRIVQTLAASRNIDLECRSGGDVPFRGDEELLRRLVLNLLDNAIRYTPPGGRVSAELEAEPDGVRIRISDTGPGIPADAVPHVFERFYRADKARSRQDGGFGLGLSIVKWIAESHRGAVELTSRAPSGSTFTVTLPR